MEEQRQRQEEEARRTQGPDVPATIKEETVKDVPSEEAMLKRALAMSLENEEPAAAAATETVAPSAAAPDFAHMTEEEQIAFAMQMSMQDQRKFLILFFSTKYNIRCTYILHAITITEEVEGTPREEPMEVEEDYATVMADTEFLQSVLENLPGVDPQSEAVRQAVGSLQQNRDKDKEKDKGKDKGKDKDKDQKK